MAFTYKSSTRQQQTQINLMRQQLVSARDEEDRRQRRITYGQLLTAMQEAHAKLAFLAAPLELDETRSDRLEFVYERLQHQFKDSVMPGTEGLEGEELARARQAILRRSVLKVDRESYHSYVAIDDDNPLRVLDLPKLGSLVAQVELIAPAIVTKSSRRALKALQELAIDQKFDQVKPAGVAINEMLSQMRADVGLTNS